jgi:hypothetical protein
MEKALLGNILAIIELHFCLIIKVKVLCGFYCVVRKQAANYR